MKELVHEVLENFSEEMNHAQIACVARQYLGHETTGDIEQALHSLNESRRLLLSWVCRDNARQIQRRQQQALGQLNAQREVLADVRAEITGHSEANKAALKQSAAPLRLLCFLQTRARLQRVCDALRRLREVQTTKEAMFSALERDEIVEAFRLHDVYTALQDAATRVKGASRKKAEAEFVDKAVQKLFFDSDLLARLGGEETKGVVEMIQKKMPAALINSAFAAQIRALSPGPGSISHVFRLGMKAILASTSLQGFSISKEVYDGMRAVVSAEVERSRDPLGSLALAVDVFEHFLKIDARYQLTGRALRALYEMRDSAFVRLRDFFAEEKTAQVHYAEAVSLDLGLPAAVLLSPQEVLQKIAAEKDPFMAMCELDETLGKTRGGFVPKFTGSFSGFSLEFARQWHQLLCFGLLQRYTMHHVAEVASAYIELLCGFIFAEMGLQFAPQKGLDPMEVATQLLKQHPGQLIDKEMLRQMKENQTETLRRGAVFTELLAWLRAHAVEALGTVRLGFSTEAQPLRDVFMAVRKSAIQLAEQYLVFKMRALFDMGPRIGDALHDTLEKKQTLQNFQAFSQQIAHWFTTEIGPAISQLTARHHLDTHRLWREDTCLLFNRKLEEALASVSFQPGKLGILSGELQRLAVTLRSVDFPWDPNQCIQKIYEANKTERPLRGNVYQ